MSERMRWVALLPLLAVLAGCGGISGTNVGEPTARTMAAFERGLAQLRVGMPVDSLEILFPDADAPGEAGVLRRARIKVADRERINYVLGWRSDPRHQIGIKDLEKIEVERVAVTAEGGRVVSVVRLPEAE